MRLFFKSPPNLVKYLKIFGVIIRRPLSTAPWRDSNRKVDFFTFSTNLNNSKFEKLIGRKINLFISILSSKKVVTFREWSWFSTKNTVNFLGIVFERVFSQRIFWIHIFFSVFFSLEKILFQWKPIFDLSSGFSISCDL